MFVYFWMISTLLVGEPGPPLRWERVVIDADFPGGYQVEVADVNGDQKPDIVALGGSTLAWYENPSWTKRVVSTAKQTPDIISSATADLDGDGKAEIAIAYDFSMNEPKRGRLLLAIQGTKPDNPWTFRPIVSERPKNIGGGFAGPGPRSPEVTGSLPSAHRLRWGMFPHAVVGPGSVSLEPRTALFVAPIFGPSARPPTFEQEPAHLIVWQPGPDPKSAQWTDSSVGRVPVLHAIEVVSLDDSKFSAILAASNRGVTSYRVRSFIGAGSLYEESTLATGAPGIAPKQGASEVHLGRFRDGRKFLATVEPWHGTDVAIYASESLQPLKFGPRLVIDATLKEGHALWVADVDGDGDDEVFAGYRGGTGGVLFYDFDGKMWTRTLLDPAVHAQDLRGGDLDGDGTPDVVAIGGQSHNIVWYRPIRPNSR